MKIAEALIKRATLNQQIGNLRGRIASNAQVQEGETPQEDPGELLEKLENVIMERAELIAAINHTNAHTNLNPDMTMTQALAQRAALLLWVSVLEGIASDATVSMPRFGRMEIKMLPVLDVFTLRERIDEFKANAAELDMEIQQKNWTTDLI